MNGKGDICFQTAGAFGEHTRFTTAQKVNLEQFLPS